MRKNATKTGILYFFKDMLLFYSPADGGMIIAGKTINKLRAELCFMSPSPLTILTIIQKYEK